MAEAPKTPAWRYGAVERSAEHFELFCQMSESRGWVPVALIGRSEEGPFEVQLLIDLAAAESSEAATLVTRELDFYFEELEEPDPWNYAIYHCGTASNVYSTVHWSYFRARE